MVQDCKERPRPEEQTGKSRSLVTYCGPGRAAVIPGSARPSRPRAQARQGDGDPGPGPDSAEPNMIRTWARGRRGRVDSGITVARSRADFADDCLPASPRVCGFLRPLREDSTEAVLLFLASPRAIFSLGIRTRPFRTYFCLVSVGRPSNHVDAFSKTKKSNAMGGAAAEHRSIFPWAPNGRRLGWAGERGQERRFLKGWFRPPTTHPPTAHPTPIPH